MNSPDPQSLTSDSDEDATTTPPAPSLEDDPGGGGGPAAGLRVYPHPHPHPHTHPHPHSARPHPPPTRPMSLHEVSMLKAELKLFTGERGDVIRSDVISRGEVVRSERNMIRDTGVVMDPRRQKPTTLDPQKSLQASGDLLKRSLQDAGTGSTNSNGAGGSVSQQSVGLTSQTSTMTTTTTERVYVSDSDSLMMVSAAAVVPAASMSGGHHVDAKHHHSGREYERLRAKCDWAENELQSLKRQHGETVSKCDQAVREADLYRHKYKLTKDKIDQLETEVHAVRADHKVLLTEKERYEYEVDELQRLREQDARDMELLEKQQREVISESGSSEVLNTMYDSAVDKYKAIKQEYDDLRRRYGELGASHNQNLSKTEMMQEENQRLRKQYEEVVADMNTAIMERKGLQSQCTAAIMKWHNAIHEKSELEKDVHKLRLERDDYKKAHKQAVADNIKTNKDIGRLRGERDAVVHEYSLIMSERDAVHKEIEQLNDKLNESTRKNEEFEAQKKSLTVEVETLRQEIASALHDRDHAHKLLNDARIQAAVDEQLGVGVGGSLGGAKGDLAELLERRGSRDTLERDRLQSSYEKSKKEAAETKELVSKEVESLRKEMEQIQADLTDALSEAELSKRRRDWAFSERDKIVLERESIKTLCDELRRERDRAVSEQAHALRDLDDLRKQKMEASRELKDVREKYEALVEKEARMRQLTQVGHNHSRDSAIDADLQEWETETLELDIGAVSSDDLGFDLCGGKDDPQLPNDSSIFISSIAKSGTAHGKLKVNDQLIRVNNVDVTNAEKRVVIQAVKNGGSVINMVVRRRKSSTTRPIQPIHLHLTGSRELGISIESGLYISRILPGSVAAKEGNLAIGDRILNVNEQSVENLSVGEVLRLVEDGGDYVVLSVLKYAPTPQPSLVSSSASSGQILPESSPEASTASPKSPRAQIWVTPSPDSAGSKQLSGIKTSGSQTDSLDSPQGGRPSGGGPPVVRDLVITSTMKGVGEVIISNKGVVSGGKTVSGDQPVLCGKACAKIFRDIYSTESAAMTRSASSNSPTTATATSPSPSGGRDLHHHGDLKSHMMVTSQTGSSQSTALQAVDDEAKEVVEEIHAIIKQQQSKPHLVMSKPPGVLPHASPRRDKEMVANGGTWPKCCQQPFDYQHHGPGAFTPGVTKKERPPLASLMNEYPYVTRTGVTSPTSSQSSHTGKVPPTPPERSDSFNRGKSIKHSPQSSDSIVKYSHEHGLATIGAALVGGATSKSSPYITPGGSKSSAIHVLSPTSRSAISQPLDPKSQAALSELQRESKRDRGDRSDSHPHKSTAAMMLHSGLHFAPTGGSGGVMSSGSVGDALPPPPPLSSTPPTVAACSPVYQQSMDTSVKSAKLNAQDQLEYSRRPRPSRPTSAPSRVRKDRREMGGLVHPLPQKPTTLPVQPMYSPRPLPSSGGQNIVPAQPFSFRPGFSSPTTVKPTHSSGTTAVAHAIIWPMQQQIPQRSSPSSLPLTSPASSMTSSLTSPTSSIASQPLSSRYTPPNGYLISRSGNDLISDTETDRIMYSLHDQRINTPSPSPSQQSSSFNQSSHTLSDEFPAYPRGMVPWGTQPGSHELTSDGCSTLPGARHHHRHYTGDHRFPQRTTPSIEKGSDRGSPVYSYQPSQSHSLPATMRHKRPQVGETRNIHVEKSQAPLGIQIDPSSTGGIFVSSVSENSLAAHAGIEVGDQLLEVCGINMRKAPYKLAASVLRQCRDSVTMLVQYNPEKYMEEESSDEPSSSDSSANNTPQTARTHPPSHRVGSDGSTITPQSLSPQSLSPSHSSKPVPTDGSYMPCEPRFVFLTKNSPQDPLGTRLVGGNAVGIYVDSVAPNSCAAGPHGLRCGDQILEFNGANLRVATAEQAELEVSKPTDGVTILAQYNVAKYNAIHDQPGDAIYVRALCDHDAEVDGELSFKKDDILFIDNTMFNSLPGVWRAWLVDEEGNKLTSGTIPSKSRLEDALAHKRSLSDTLHDDELKGSRRGSASARRSFFRRKKHTRNNSKDSRELNSFSDASINSDSVPYLDDGQTMPFQRVERLDCMINRPVLILGPLSEPLIEKLTSESPDKYCRCKLERVRATQSSLEAGRDKGVFLDYQRRDSHYECLRVDTIKDIIDKNRHAMLNCSPEAIERLHKVQIYPIVLFVRHKTPKQIREVKDTRFLPEKVSNKVAKELFELHQEYEHKYKVHFSDIIQGGNLAYMSVNIKGAVDKQQRKTLWIPAGSI